MRYKVGAEQLQQVPTLLHRPDTAFRASRVAPAGPTHAVSTRTGETACGIPAEGLEVLDQDWEQACFVEKCPGASPPSWPTPATSRIALVAAHDLLAQALVLQPLDRDLHGSLGLAAGSGLFGRGVGGVVVARRSGAAFTLARMLTTRRPRASRLTAQPTQNSLPSGSCMTTK